MEKPKRPAPSGVWKAHHGNEFKLTLIKRLNRIGGQIRGIAGMIDKDVYCDEILHQISSVESALDGVKRVPLEAHVKGCVVEQLMDGRDEVIAELMVTMRKVMK